MKNEGHSNSRRPISRVPLVADRIRSTGKRGFAFVPNHFLQDGFFAALGRDELLLYFLLVLAGDRQGISFYHYDSICSLLHIPLEHYLSARNQLIAKDLIAFDGTRIQVLELPAAPPASRLLRTQQELEAEDAATIRLLIEESLEGK